MNKRRKTRTKRISELLKKGNLWHAESVCRYGRDLSYVESFVRNYYEALDAFEAAEKGVEIFYPVSKRMTGKISSDQYWALHKKLESAKDAIAGIFLTAMSEHNQKKIIELAKAAKFFEDKRYPKLDGVDDERLRLIILKRLIQETGERPTVRQVAQFLALDRLMAGEKLHTPADGFSALRRKCKQIGLSLASSRKIRRT